MPNYDIIIIGAGAAGLMAAGKALAGGMTVLLCDKNHKPGRKLLITGKGRCNVTNNCSPDAVMQKTRSNPRFLYSAFSAFTPADTMTFFESHGVPLKTERGGRVFPQSDNAADIVDALRRYARDAQYQQADIIKIICNAQGGVQGVQAADGTTYTAPAVLLATGGKSYPLTGSDGSGYALAKGVGHSIIPPRPSLIPIVTQEDWPAQAMGLSLRNVTLTLTKQGVKKPVYTELGEMLFTHFGVSGPLVLTASSYMQGTAGYKLAIDLKPALRTEQLDARILRDFEENLNRNFENALDKLLPKSIIPVMVQLSGIGGSTKVHSITKEQRQGLVQLIKALPLTPKAFRPIDEAIITAGGVQVKEVNPGDMQSKLVQGLYFAGEVLDTDATTGGYNLQIAFSTAYLAAESILQTNKN